MTNLTFELEGDALREAIAQSILGQLTPEVQRGILDKAVQAILASSTNSFDRFGRSPLQIAFENAVQNVAQQQALRLVQEDEGIKTKLQQLLRETADRVLATDAEKLSQRMAEAFISSMKNNY